MLWWVQESTMTQWDLGYWSAGHILRYAANMHRRRCSKSVKAHCVLLKSMYDLARIVILCFFSRSKSNKKPTPIQYITLNNINITNSQMIMNYIWTRYRRRVCVWQFFFYHYNTNNKAVIKFCSCFFFSFVILGSHDTRIDPSNIFILQLQIVQIRSYQVVFF